MRRILSGPASASCKLLGITRPASFPAAGDAAKLRRHAFRLGHHSQIAALPAPDPEAGHGDAQGQPLQQAFPYG